MEDKVPVYRAAKLYGVPLTTLRDRVDNRISMDTTSSGPAPVLNQLEEAKLVEHIKEMAYVGYGYTRAEILNMATDYAIRSRDVSALNRFGPWVVSVLSRFGRVVSAWVVSAQFWSWVVSAKLVGRFGPFFFFRPKFFFRPHFFF